MSAIPTLLRYNVRNTQKRPSSCATGGLRRCAKARLPVSFVQMNDAISSRDFGDDRRLGVVGGWPLPEQIGRSHRAVEDARQKTIGLRVWESISEPA